MKARLTNSKEYNRRYYEKNQKRLRERRVERYWDNVHKERKASRDRRREKCKK